MTNIDMKLPFKFPFGRTEKKNYFLALLLHDEKASVVIFEETLGKIHITGKHKEYFNDSIESISLEELLEIIDKTIVEAESSLPDNIQTQKTIFGLKEDWIENGKIKKEQLLKLKKISEALDLSPIGFLIIHEAIANLIQQEEGIPISAIFIETEIKNITVSALKAGKLLETKRTKIENSIVETADKLLHSFESYEVLPSRIILLADQHSEKLAQEFTGHSWSKNLPFLHVPRITVLPKEFDAKAIIFGAAREMGFEILGDNEPLKKQHEITADNISNTEETRIEELSKKSDLTQENNEEKEELFGFVKNIDISLSSNKTEELKLELEKETEINSAKSEEVIQDENIKPISEQVNEKEEPQTEITGGKKLNILLIINNLIKNSLSIILKLGKKINFKNISLPNIQLPKKNRFIFIPPFVIVVFIALLLLYIFAVKATITLYVEPKIIEKEKTMIFSTNPNDEAQNMIPVTSVSVSESGTTTVPATGKKEIGDKAKGTVTLYNSDLRGGKNIAKGIVITSSNGLDFTIDSSISLASASGDASSIIPSTQKISVTASRIGKEYNLPSLTKFSVESFDTSTVIAKNEGAFSGGSKKEINVVTKEDVDKASSDLTAKLEPNAKTDIAKKLTADYSLFPFFTDTSLTKKELNKDIGEEATTLTIESTVTFEGASYKKSDLEELAKNLLEEKNGLNNLASINYSLNDPKQEKKGDISAILDVKASILPKIDIQKIIQTITGKTFADSEKILLKLPQAEKVEINLIPNIPFLPRILPRIPKNINLQVKNNG